MNVNDLIIRGRPVIDIGAHIGNKTNDYLSLGSSYVVAVEAQPCLAEKLINRFEGRPVVVVCAAVADKPGGFVQIQTPEKGSAIATITEHWKSGRFAGYAWNNYVKVPTVTMEGLFVLAGGDPSYIKVDVEGAERLVAAGMESCTPDAISFEYTHEFMGHIEDIVRFMYSHLYQFTYTLGESNQTVLEPSKWSVFWDHIREHSKPGDWGSFFAIRTKNG